MEWGAEELGLREGAELFYWRQAVGGAGGRPSDGVWRVRGHYPCWTVWRRHRDAVGSGNMGATAWPYRRGCGAAGWEPEVCNAWHEDEGQVGTDQDGWKSCQR